MPWGIRQGSDEPVEEWGAKLDESGYYGGGGNWWTWNGKTRAGAAAREKLPKEKAELKGLC
eukprot:1431794-Pyramimonas_sp.AAC.1